MFERLIPNAAASYEFIQQQSATATAMGFEPDMVSIMDCRKGTHRGTHTVCWLNLLGYIPGVSTVTGAYRTLVALVFLVKSAACAIFDTANRVQHLEGIKIAAANIGRGLLEMIPVIGNLFVINIDVSRMMHRWADYSERPYGDSNSIPIFGVIDTFGAIPIVGTVVNLARSIFFVANVLVNVPPALVTPRYYKAVEFGMKQVVIGLFESIPIVGTISACIRNFPAGTGFNVDPLR